MYEKRHSRPLAIKAKLYPSLCPRFTYDYCLVAHMHKSEPSIDNYLENMNFLVILAEKIPHLVKGPHLLIRKIPFNFFC